MLGCWLWRWRSPPRATCCWIWIPVLFAFGLGAFLLAHLTYICLFVRNREAGHPGGAGGCGAWSIAA